MDISPVLVADLQAPKRLSQGERPFDHPAVELNKWRASAVRTSDRPTQDEPLRSGPRYTCGYNDDLPYCD